MAVLAEPPVTSAPLPSDAVPPDPDFGIRWAAWITRGQMHEQRTRRRLLVWVPVIAVGAAIAFALSNS